MLTVNNLNYSYKKGRPVLKSIDLSIEPGITLLIGENGSGKSTLLRLLSQDLTSPVPVLWNGMELSRNDLKRNLAYLPQEFDIYPMLKVRELLEFVAAAKGVPICTHFPIAIPDYIFRLDRFSSTYCCYTCDRIKCSFLF